MKELDWFLKKINTILSALKICTITRCIGIDSISSLRTGTTSLLFAAVTQCLAQYIYNLKIFFQ